MKKRMLIKWDVFMIAEMKQEIRFTEECLYEAVRLYRKNKNMPALIAILALIIKARGEKNDKVSLNKWGGNKANE